MILEQQTDNLVLQEGEVQETFNTEIDIESLHFLKTMLSKFYSDPIGSCIREVASNALDSHREADCTDPIIVSFKANKDGNWEFSIEDFGIGVNKDTINNVLRKYGKSTKRLSVNQLGAYGLGWKSPIAYTSSFYFIGRKDGVEIKAMMYESEDDIDIDVLYEAPTTERNGCKVIIPVKYGDRYNFINRIKEQLAYFENVYFDCGGDIINENIKIYRHDLFQISSLCNNNNMHICLDDVYYPLDWQKLEIPSIDLKLALRFSLSDGIFPVPNREAIKYTKESKEIIINKIKEVSNWFIEQYNKQVDDTDNIQDIFRYYDHSNHVYSLQGVNYYIDKIKQYSNIRIVTPNLKGIKYVDLKRIHTVRDYLLQEYHITHHLRNTRFSTYKNVNKLNIWTLDRNKVYIHNDAIAKQTKDYLRDSSDYQTKYFIRKEGNIKLKPSINRYQDYSNWINILDLRNKPKNIWRDHIKEAQYIQTLMLKEVENIDNLVIPQKWIDDKIAAKKSKVVKNVKKKRVKLEGEINCKIARKLQKWNSTKNCYFDQSTLDLGKATQSKDFIIYGNREHTDEMDKWYMIMPKNIKFVVFSERELKNLKDIDFHNWIHMDEFLKGNNKQYKRVVSAYLIKLLQQSNSGVFYNSEIVRDLSKDLANKLEELEEYSGKYYINGNEELYKVILEHAHNNNLYDSKIHDIYKEVKQILDKFTFLNPMLNNFNGEEKERINILRDLCKYHGYKLNWENYQKLELNEQN